MPTTATDWLENHPDDIELLDELIAGTEGIPIHIWTEIPEEMKLAISKQLTESFAQDYWDEISVTTGGDAERVIREGLEKGWSIRKMATEMATSFQGNTKKYARMRATRIARTESTDALNGARRQANDQLAEDLGPEIPMKSVWLSVLGNTTRDAHANLHGVPADVDGLWDLGGVRVPWPGHFSLPAENRVNCLCSLFLEFGMQEGEANQLIADFYGRLEEGL